MDNHIFLLKKMAMVGGPNSGYDGLESGVPYNFEALGDYSNYPTFFEWNGAKSMTFPSFKFDAENVPIGDSAKMCMGISWVPIKKKNQYDKYMEMKGFPQCELWASGKALWESDYPTHGVNFKMWDQISTKGDSTCTNGIYVAATDICFTYKTMR